MLDEFDILKLVAERLDAAAIPYMIDGSLALSYYAQPRLARDIDLVVALGAADVTRVVTLFMPDFLFESTRTRGRS